MTIWKLSLSTAYIFPNTIEDRQALKARHSRERERRNRHTCWGPGILAREKTDEALSECNKPEARSPNTVRKPVWISFASRQAGTSRVMDAFEEGNKK